MTTMTKKTMTTIEKALAEGTQHIGDFAWWGLQDANVVASDFRTAWKNAGLAESCLQDDRTTHRNLRDAGLAALSSSDGYLWRFVDKSEATDASGSTVTVVKYAIVKEVRDATTERVTYTQECLVTAMDGSPGLTFSPAAHPFAVRVESEWLRLAGTFTSVEIRKTIQNALEIMKAVALRDHGGVYWVPPVHATSLRALKGVIEKVGGSQFAVLPIYGSDEATETLSQAATVSLEQSLSDLRAEIANFKSDGARKGTLERRLVEFTDLRDRARMYRDVLAIEVTSLNDGLDELQVEVEAMLKAQELAAAKSAA